MVGSVLFTRLCVCFARPHHTGTSETVKGLRAVYLVSCFFVNCFHGDLGSEFSRTCLPSTTRRPQICASCVTDSDRLGGNRLRVTVFQPSRWLLARLGNNLAGCEKIALNLLRQGLRRPPPGASPDCRSSSSLPTHALVTGKTGDLVSLVVSHLLDFIIPQKHGGGQFHTLAAHGSRLVVNRAAISLVAALFHQPLQNLFIASCEL
jgi:hypothetical protein